MCSVFTIFLVELIAHRAGAAFLRRRGLLSIDAHSSTGNEVGHSTHGAHVESSTTNVGGRIGEEEEDSMGKGSEEVGHDHRDEYKMDENALAQILGVAILEFGVIFHVRMLFVSFIHRCIHPSIRSFYHFITRIKESKTDNERMLQSFIIGLTLAVNTDFTTLFIVLVFHR